MSIHPRKASYSPLERISISGVKGRSVRILDGQGEIYSSRDAASADRLSFVCGGALGNHIAMAMDAAGGLPEIISFKVAACTRLDDGTGRFGPLLGNLHLTMRNSCGGDGSQFVRVGGKTYSYFIRWLRDHTHTMKGMKYFHPLLKTGLELYADTQREDGMLFERIAPKEKDVQGWRDHTFKEGGFVRTVHSNPDGTGVPYTLQRIPVENDVEYLFVECLYYTWKATGDCEWMEKYLDHSIKALKYSMSDKFRWSRKFGLLKRAYTIDTWDFIHKDDGKLTLGDNCFDKDKTVFGAMFGDSTGMAVSCRYLAEMLRHAGRGGEALKYERIADKLFGNLDKVAWNGEFYTHHVSEDASFRRDVGKTDESRQVTLSNAYSINRKIGEDKSIAIIGTYKRIRNEMPESSPGEFYNCYPPFEKGFGEHDAMWQYMNGGVSTIVAGELARGAFTFGEEEYGAEILERMKKLADGHEGHLHVCFNGNPEKKAPTRKFSILDISTAADVTPEWREIGGWGDKGNDLSRMPRGRREFLGVPFKIGDKGVGISSACGGFSRESVIPVRSRFASVYLLHTSGGSGTAAEMELKYSDGTARSVYIQKGRNCDNWFMPESGESKYGGHAPKLSKGWPEYQIAWRGSSGKFDNVGVFIWGFDNPCPDKEVFEIVFKAMKTAARHLVLAMTTSDKPVWFPQSDLSFGIPDGWGAAAVVYALFEGLAGIVDRGVAFDKAEISPRWIFAGEKKADIVVKYEASGGYVAYSWRKTRHGMEMAFTSSARDTMLRLPLAGMSGRPKVILDGTEAGHAVERSGKSRYAVLKVAGKGAHRVELLS